MKLVVNLVLGASMVVLGEALALERLGAPEGDGAGRPGDSPIAPAVAAKRANIESGRYEPGVRAAARREGSQARDGRRDGDNRDLKVARATLEWLEEASRRGAGDLDFSAVVTTIAGEEHERLKHAVPREIADVDRFRR